MSYLHRNIILSAMVFLFTVPCSAAWRGTRSSNFWAVDVEAYVTNLHKRVTTPKLYQSNVSHITGFARLRRGFHLGKRFYFEPSFGTLFPWLGGSDGSVKTFTFHWDLNFLIPVVSFFRFRVGPGLEWDITFTSAEEVSLDNGTGTSTFYIPGGNSSSFLATVLVGFEVLFSKRISMNVDLYTQNILDDYRRRFHAAIGVGIIL